MRTVTRRRFVQGTAAVGGAAATSKFLFDGFDTVARADEVVDAAMAQLTEDVVPTTCWVGKQDCGMLARRVNGRVVKFEGHPANPLNYGTLCPKGQAQIGAVYDPNRVKTPLVRTNAKGEPGTWRSASWDEALELVAAEVNETRARNPKLVLWQKGRSKAKSFYDTAFVKAIGSSKLGHGAYCSDTGYRALEYTIGLHGVLHPDFRYTKYLLSWGWNITNAGGNKFCWLTWPRHLLAARERGMKIVHIDPRLRSAGPFADRWLAIKPGTDLAFALALCHELIANGHIDEEYLTRYTNAPYLVEDDGMFHRGDGDEPLVLDAATNSFVPASQAEAPTLRASTSHNGVAVKTAFEVFAEHVEQYTPEWAAEVCGIATSEIRRVAREYGEEAVIGSTIMVDGVEVPYRPVSIMAYHMVQQELGFQAMRAMLIVSMLVGAVGAAGGQFSDKTWKIDGKYTSLDEVEIGDGPYDFTLNKSKFYPINSGHPGLVAKVMADPERYDVEELPEVAILHMVNPLGSFADQDAFISTYEKFRFVAWIGPWISETADYFADVVLPSATIEKYEGPMSATDLYVDAKSMRLPPMEPLFESRGEIDIYLDLAAAIGVLEGEDGYIAQVNKALELEGEFALPLRGRPEVRDIFDRWARAQGIEEGLAFFEEHGVWVKGPVKPTKFYGYATDPVFGGVVHRLYGESLARYQKEMKARGVDDLYAVDYTALPTWREPTMEQSPGDYDLYLISYKLIEHKQARTSYIPLLNEISPGQRLDINPATARARGITDGAEVWVESHNAVTGETRRVKTVAAYTEGMRPDTVGMPHHFGLWTHPASRDRGPTPNALYFTGEGYTVNTADQSFHVKVRAYPEGGESA